MNPKIIVTFITVSVDNGTPYAAVYALVFGADGKIMDNPYGPEVGAYNTAIVATPMTTQAGARAAIIADITAAYNLEGDVDVEWL